MLLGIRRRVVVLILDVLCEGVVVDGQAYSRVVFVLGAWVWYRFLHSYSSPAR